MIAPFRCPDPDCGTSFEVDTLSLAREVSCPQCGKSFPFTFATRVGVDQPPTEPIVISPPRPSPLPGEGSIIGNYDILRPLGRGGMGEVWLARHRELDVERALKFIRDGIAGHPQALARFRREARLMARFSHPNAVTVHNAELLGNIAYIDMEFVHGKSVDKLLTRGKPMPLDWTARLLVQICGVLQVAHDKNIIHRDLKPSNMMLVDGRPEGQEFLKVLDFGIAKMLGAEEAEAESITNAGSLMGTTPYASPEQLAGTADRPSDIYSVGVILFELLTGHRPFSGPQMKQMYDTAHTPPPSFADVNPDARVPAAIEGLVKRCLAKHPADRPQSARQLADEFLDALNLLESTADDRRLKEPGPSTNHRRHRRPTIIAAAASFVLAVTGVVILIVTDRGTVRIEGIDPQMEVKIDGENVRISDKDGPIALRVGSHGLTVTRGDATVEAPSTFTVTRGGQTVVDVKWSPKPPYVPHFPDTQGGSKATEANVVKDGRASPFTGMKFKVLPAGEFEMGSPDAEGEPDEHPRHHVAVPTFAMAIHEVTQREYRLVTGNNPSFFKGSDELPVENVSWLDAVKFCNALSEKDGLRPYYDLRDGAGQVSVQIPDPRATGYRLPTEEEWEYACRAGGAAPYSFGADEGVLDRYAWFLGNSGETKGGDENRRTHPVGGKEPNGFGLRDMHGNVWEWCWDLYKKDGYGPADGREPASAEYVTGNRILRGGSRAAAPSNLRSAYRFDFDPTRLDRDNGFRVARNYP